MTARTHTKIRWITYELVDARGGLDNPAVPVPPNGTPPVSSACPPHGVLQIVSTIGDERVLLCSRAVSDYAQNSPVWAFNSPHEVQLGQRGRCMLATDGPGLALHSDSIEIPFGHCGPKLDSWHLSNDRFGFFGFISPQIFNDNRLDNLAYVVYAPWAYTLAKELSGIAGTDFSDYQPLTDADATTEDVILDMDAIPVNRVYPSQMEGTLCPSKKYVSVLGQNSFYETVTKGTPVTNLSASFHNISGELRGRCLGSEPESNC